MEGVLGQEEHLKKYGWYAHYVLDDMDCPNRTNYHTHMVRENFHHPDLQICLPIRPEVAKFIFISIVEEIKNGNKFYPRRPYLGVVANPYTLTFLPARNGGRKILRVIIPEENGKYLSPEFSAQLTRLDDGHPLTAVFYEQEDITSMSDVYFFLTSLKLDYKININPDKPFDEYRTFDGKNIFSLYEARNLSFVLKKCIEVCRQNGYNIHDISDSLDIIIRKRKEFVTRGGNGDYYSKGRRF